MSHPSGRPDETIQEDEAAQDSDTEEYTDEEQGGQSQEDEQGSVSTGQRIKYDTRGGHTCWYNIDKIIDNDDESSVHGHFEVEIPAGAMIIDAPRFDRSNFDVYVTYRLGDEAFELYFNVGEDPQELRDWEVYVDFLVVKTKPAV